MPKVSVIIPCYNQAHYLPDAVKSIAEQTFRDVEIIIVNDGSPDSTRGVAESLKEQYAACRIKLINQENKGLPVTRNNGIQKASGEYMLPLDADDMILPTFLEETVKLLDQNPGAGFAYTGQMLFGEVPEGLEDYRYGSEYDFKELLKANRVPVCGLFRKSAWEEVGGYKKMNPIGLEDWEFWISLGEAGHPGKFINKPLFMYRKHGQTMLSGAIRKHHEIVHELKRLHPKSYYPWLSKINPNLARGYNSLKWLFFRCVRRIISITYPCFYYDNPGLHYRAMLLFRDYPTFEKKAKDNIARRFHRLTKSCPR